MLARRVLRGQTSPWYRHRTFYQLQFFLENVSLPVNHVDCDCVSPAKQRDGSQLIVSQLLFLSIDTVIYVS